MSLAKDLMQLGIADQAAIRLGFQTGAIVGAGTTSVDAAVLPAMSTLVTVTGALDSGVKLPASAELGVPYILAHIGANQIRIYPPTGGSINGGTVTTGHALLLSRAAVTVVRIDTVNWALVKGAATP